MKNKLGEDIIGLEFELLKVKSCSIGIYNDGLTEFCSEDESGGLLENIGYSIIAQKETGENESIGLITGYLLHAGLELDNEEFDMIGGDIFHLSESFIEEDMEPFIIDGAVDSTFYFLETIIINENYRKMGIGSLIMKYIEDILLTTTQANHQDQICGIILYAHPIDDKRDRMNMVKKKAYENTKDFKRKESELKKFYKRNGFKSVGTNEPKYMYKCFPNAHL